MYTHGSFVPPDSWPGVLSCLPDCLLWTDGDSSLHSNRLSRPNLTGADVLGGQWLVRLSSEHPHRMLRFPRGEGSTSHPGFGVGLKGSSPCLASDSQTVRGEDRSKWEAEQCVCVNQLKTALTRNSQPPLGREHETWRDNLRKPVRLHQNHPVQERPSSGPSPASLFLPPPQGHLQSI